MNVRTVEKVKKNRPKNTTRTYNAPQKAWAQFCKEKQFDDGEHVTQDKLLWFLHDIVLTKRVPPKKKALDQETVKKQAKRDRKALEEAMEETRGGLIESDERLTNEICEEVINTYEEGVAEASSNSTNSEGAPLKYDTVKSYVSAIMDLYHYQLAMKLHSNPSPRGYGVRAVLKDIQMTTWRRIRERHEDRAIGTVLDSYTRDDLLAFVNACWQEGHSKHSVSQYSRTLLDFLIGHCFMCRGVLRRNAELADMFLLRLDNESATQACWCWIFVFDNGKTNKAGKKQYLGAIRHADFRLCPFGAFAFYFFIRFHLRKEAWPSLRKLEDWDRIKVLLGEATDRERPLNDTTHRNWIQRVFKLIGLLSSKKTHAPRKSAAQWAEILGVPEEEVSAHISFANVSQCFIRLSSL